MSKIMHNINSKIKQIHTKNVEEKILCQFSLWINSDSPYCFKVITFDKWAPANMFQVVSTAHFQVAGVKV